MSANGTETNKIRNVRGVSITPDPKPPKRIINKPYVQKVARKSCICCGRPSGPPHHVRAYGWGATSRKPDDYYVVALCPLCHDLIHNRPKEFDKTDLLLSIIENLIEWIEKEAK